MTMQEMIARRFSALLRNCLSHHALTEAIKKNAAEPHSEVCHTHDHVDANMVMADAFKECTGREIDLQSVEDSALWGEAWYHAKAKQFYTCPARDLKPGMTISRHGIPALVIDVKPWVHPHAGAVIAITHRNPQKPNSEGVVSFQTSALVPLS